MDKEVDPQVLAVIDEKRLSGPRLTPVEIVAKMGVFDARDKPYEYAWMATGDNVIATIWAEYVSVGAGGRWFYLESLDTQHRAGGGVRTANQVQRAKDRLRLAQAHARRRPGLSGGAADQPGRRSPNWRPNKSAKVSTRVRDDDEWHVASWEPDQMLAVLVRGPRGWLPTEAEVQAAKARGGVPAPAEATPAAAQVTSPEELQAAALAYVTHHFGGYGYKAEDVRARQLGYDLEVSNAKGVTLLKVAVKGTASGLPGFKLTGEERAASVRDPLWRLLVVTDVGGPAAQHKIYKPSEIDQAPGLEPLLQ